MTGGLMMSGARLALLAASGLFVMGAATAQAADLGGNCCADLEERIAELEATTARKGNRKVKLEISGHINEAVLIWDDGVESNGGVYTNDNSRTRFRFKGEAKIDDDWKAGYLIEIGIRTANSKRFNQENPAGCTESTTSETKLVQGSPLPAPAAVNNCGLDVRHSTWYIDSKRYGRVWVGLTGGAGESITEINLANSKDVLKYSDIEDSGLGLYTRTGGGTRIANFSSTSGRTGLQWRQLLRGGGDQPGEGRRYNLVRYDTPEIAGFTGTANWGEDDTWEMGLRYKGEFSGFKLAAGFAYGENSEGPINSTNADPVPGFQCLGNNRDGNLAPSGGGPDTSCRQYGGSVSIMHEETGIYGNFAAGLMDDDAMATDPGFSQLRGIETESYFYAFEAGIEKKWNSLGKTTLFGQYYRNEGGSQDRGVGTVNDACSWNNPNDVPSNFDGCRVLNIGDILSSEITSYGLGVVQSVDNAAMSLYVTYRHYEGEVTGNAAGKPKLELDDLDVGMAGALIKF